MWVASLAIMLLLPFWGILMFIRCKFKLDSWLEFSLAHLNAEAGKLKLDFQAGILEEQGAPVDAAHVVNSLVTAVNDLQEYLANIWNAECGWLVNAATKLLWMSAVAALNMTSVSVAIFLYDKGGAHATSAPYFAAAITVSCIVPALYLLLIRKCRSSSDDSSGEVGKETNVDHFPLADRELSSRPRRLSILAEKSRRRLSTMDTYERPLGILERLRNIISGRKTRNPESSQRSLAVSGEPRLHGRNPPNGRSRSQAAGVLDYLD
jgi:hypothetical protein